MRCGMREPVTKTSASIVSTFGEAWFAGRFAKAIPENNVVATRIAKTIVNPFTAENTPPRLLSQWCAN